MTRPVSPLPPAARPHPHPAPPGACDTHVHLLAAPSEARLYAARTEDPAQPYAAYLAGYRAHLAALGITRGVIVQSIFYGLDNTVTIRAVRDMGPGFAGIGLLPDAASEADLDAFAATRLRGVRLNHVHGGVLSWAGARAMAPALAARDMHIQMLLHADRHMAEIADDVAACLRSTHSPPDVSGPGDPGYVAPAGDHAQRARICHDHAQLLCADHARDACCGELNDFLRRSGSSARSRSRISGDRINSDVTCRAVVTRLPSSTRVSVFVVV